MKSRNSFSKTKAVILILSFLFAVMFAAPAFAKTYDLVLLHGLTNKHQWSDSFLDKLAATWGSGNVYVIYTNSSTRIWYRYINGRKITYCGENDFTAGDDYIWDQAAFMRTKILLLQQSYGLSAKFNIIAHSMGGLVSRYYIWAYPYTVAGVVSLGTPHHGSPLAYVADFIIDYFLGAEHAMEHLKPSFVDGYFKTDYPVSGAPLADSGKYYTIRGDADGWDCWGWGGELFAGWTTLSTVYWTDNDGLVPYASAVMTGATHVADFTSYDHQELVTKADVATKAALYLR